MQSLYFTSSHRVLIRLLPAGYRVTDDGGSVPGAPTTTTTTLMDGAPRRRAMIHQQLQDRKRSVPCGGVENYGVIDSLCSGGSESSKNGPTENCPGKQQPHGQWRWQQGALCDASTAEAFLDENPRFLKDYVRRKISKSMLEEWLFGSDSQVK